MVSQSQRIPYLLLAVVAAIVALSFQGTRGLWLSTESRYAECAREMLDSGRWLEPQLDGQPHWSKPPPTYWAISAGLALLGRNEWGARLYDAAALVAATLAVAALAGAMWDRKTAILAGLIYATSPFPVAAANSVSTDTLLTLWLLLAVLAYWKAVAAAAAPQEHHRGRSRLWIILMWACVGLGFATKGPPALLVPASIVVFHLIARRRGRTMPRLHVCSVPIKGPLPLEGEVPPSGGGEGVGEQEGPRPAVTLTRPCGPPSPSEGERSRHTLPRDTLNTYPRLASPVGLALAAVIGLSWYVWAVLTHPGLLGYFLGDEIIGRVATDKFGRNSEWYMPLVLYLPPLAVGAGLWTLFYPSILRRNRSSLSWSSFKALLARSDRALFLVLWLVPPLVVFSVVQSRLSLYVLPLFGAVALATARSLVRRVDDRAFRKVCLVAGTLAIVLAVGGKGLVAYWPSNKDERPLYRSCLAAAAGPSATGGLAAGPPQVVLVDSRDRYGLQFYCDGRFARLPAEAAPPEFDPALARVIRQVRDAPQAEVYVFVVRAWVDLSNVRHWDPRIGEALAKAGLKFSDRIADDKRQLLIVRTSAPRL